MANIRFLYNNTVNASLTSVTASTTAGALVASNVLTDLKSQVWRSTSNTGSLTFNWSAPHSISMVAVPFCTLSSTATIRVQLYTNIGDPTPVYDSGVVSAGVFQMPLVTALAGGNNPGVNSYGQGGANQVVMYTSVVSVAQMILTFVDTSLTYIEVGRVLVGRYWEPSVNVPYGSVTMGMGDDSKHTRSDSGDIFTDVGPRYKTLDFNFQYLPTTDRDNLWRVLRGNGMSTPVFIDVVPGTTDAGDEFIYSIYGKLAKSSAIAMTMFNQYASTLSWTEI